MRDHEGQEDEPSGGLESHEHFGPGGERLVSVGLNAMELESEK